MSGEDEDVQAIFDDIVRRYEEGDPAARAEARRILEAVSPPTNPPPKTFPDGWYVIRVELISGRADEFEPPPGRDILVSPQHTFRQLADVINASFARWDLGHLYCFRMADGTRIATPSEDEEDDDDVYSRLAPRTKLARREEGEVFEYEFDFGDGWMHRCTVIAAGIDPEHHYGAKPKGPVAIWGWGNIPDQYGRTRPEGEEAEEEVDD